MILLCKCDPRIITDLLSILRLKLNLQYSFFLLSHCSAKQKNRSPVFDNCLPFCQRLLYIQRIYRIGEIFYFLLILFNTNSQIPIFVQRCQRIAHIHLRRIARQWIQFISFGFKYNLRQRCIPHIYRHICILPARQNTENNYCRDKNRSQYSSSCQNLFHESATPSNHFILPLHPSGYPSSFPSIGVT